ncbi:unnamed protein product, partial [Brassica rapa]
VCGCPCVSVCILQHTQNICGCPSVHISARGSLDSACWPFPWTVQDTQDVCGCPSVHISACWSLDSARWPFPWTVWVILAHVACMFSTHKSSVGVRQHTQDVCGCPCVSVSTHRTSVADVCGCPCVSVCDRQHTQDIRGCPSVHISARWSLDSARWPFPWTVRVILANVGCLFSTNRTSVGVRQHTQDVHVCPSAHTGRPTHWTSVAVRVCPCVSVSTHRTLVAVHQYTYQHAGRPWVSVSTHRTSVCVRQHTQDVRG